MADPRAEIRELLVAPPQFRDEDRPDAGTFEAETSDVVREQAADDLLDAYRGQILAEPRPFPHGFPRVQGRCPACRMSALFLGDGGYVTCGNLQCTNPCAATELLEQP